MSNIRFIALGAAVVVVAVAIAWWSFQHAPRSPDLALLELTIVPPSQATVDGVVYGVSPVTLHVPVGAHSLRIENEELGIHITHPFTISPTTVVQSGVTPFLYFVEKASLSITGPTGAAVSLDGKPLGQAPVADHIIWAGEHKLVAALGEKHWERDFRASAKEKVSLSVDRP